MTIVRNERLEERHRQHSSRCYYKNREHYLIEMRKRYRMNKEKYINNIRVNRNNIRYRLIELLGSKCIRCGFSDPRALQIDHVNGNGAKDRKSKDSYTMYRRMIKEIQSGSKEYQLLCANCNWIKRQERREYN